MASPYHFGVTGIRRKFTGSHRLRQGKQGYLGFPILFPGRVSKHSVLPTMEELRKASLAGLRDKKQSHRLSCRNMSLVWGQLGARNVL